MAKKIVEKKPLLVKAGNHLIDPTDVACITKLKNRKLYIVRLKSQPNMEYPIWVEKNQIESLLKHFKIEVSDVPEVDES